MWGAYRYAMNWFGGLDRHEWLMVLAAGMVFGFLCMRGYGSRSNY